MVHSHVTSLNVPLLPVQAFFKLEGHTQVQLAVNCKGEVQVLVQVGGGGVAATQQGGEDCSS